jgi:hypothetical protein
MQVKKIRRDDLLTWNKNKERRLCCLGFISKPLLANAAMSAASYSSISFLCVAGRSLLCFALASRAVVREVSVYFFEYFEYVLLFCGSCQVPSSQKVN